MNYQTPLPDGVYTATLTPLNKDLSVDYDALIAHCKWLLANGSDGIALLGTTGEANAFTMDERIEMIDKVIAGGIPGDRLMAGTGCCASADTIQLTRHAVERGIGGILLLPPFYYKQVTDTGLAKYFDIVISGINDDRLKIYLYHFPKMSGIGFSTPLTKHLINEYPGVVVGMKDSTGDFNHLQEIINEVPGFNLYAGTEELLLDVLEIGGVGCISATANVTVALAAKVYQAWKEGNDTDTMDAHLKAVRAVFDGLPFTGALKSYLGSQPDKTGWRNVRPPNTLLDAGELEGLLERLRLLDFI